jgi:hypothetical protein
MGNRVRLLAKLETVLRQNLTASRVAIVVLARADAWEVCVVIAKRIKLGRVAMGVGSFANSATVMSRTLGVTVASVLDEHVFLDAIADTSALRVVLAATSLKRRFFRAVARLVFAPPNQLSL